MAIPSGSGTEVLKVSAEKDNTGWMTCISGVANHIYIILNFSICDANDNELTTGFQVKLDGNGAGMASDEVYLYQNVFVPSKGTFIHNDRIIMSGTTDFKIKTFENAHLIVNYIDQDWT